MRSLFIALFIAFPVIIFAQPNYHEGYVLKNNGDTLRGYVNYREWAYSPSSVEFKRNKTNNEVLEFTPQTIKGFQVTGFETYVSYVGLISMNKNIFPDIPSNLDTNRQQGAIFLKQLVTGDHITLYFNNQVGKNRFFIAEKNDVPIELKYFEYYGTSKSDEVYDNLFRGQLLLLIYKYNNGDQKLIGKLEEVRFEQPDLEHIVDLINNNDPNKPVNRIGSEKRVSKIRFFGGIGANITTTKYVYLASTTGSSNGLAGETFNMNYYSLHSYTLSPKINWGIDIFTNPNVQQLIFRAELSYSYANAEFNQNINEVNGTPSAIYSFSFTQYSTSLTPQFLYNVYNTDKLKIYLDAGATLNFLSYSNNSANGSQSVLALKSFWADYPFQAGVVFNRKIEIHFTYTTYAVYTNNIYASFANQSMCLGVKYLF